MEYASILDIDFKSSIGGRVAVHFLAKDVGVRDQKGGKKYIGLKMCCNGREVEAKKFDASPTEIEMMKNGQIYNAMIDIKEYAASPDGYSAIISAFDVRQNADRSLYLEYSQFKDVNYNQICELVQSIKDEVYYKITYDILGKFWTDFFEWGAASGMHHEVMGGLAAHIAEVAQQSLTLADYWEKRYTDLKINRSLLVSASLLHDIGKMIELDLDKSSGTISYSIAASLESHIMSALELVAVSAYKQGIGVADGVKKDEELDIENEKLMLLKHCIGSHHGRKDWGSPIEPAIPEAFIINAADNMSADMYRFEKHFANMESSTSKTLKLNGTMRAIFKSK